LTEEILYSPGKEKGEPNGKGVAGDCGYPGRYSRAPRATGIVKHRDAREAITGRFVPANIIVTVI
jgi:hypothetical protein